MCAINSGGRVFRDNLGGPSSIAEEEAMLDKGQAVVLFDSQLWCLTTTLRWGDNGCASLSKKAVRRSQDARPSSRRVPRFRLAWASWPAPADMRWVFETLLWEL